MNLWSEFRALAGGSLSSDFFVVRFLAYVEGRATIDLEFVVSPVITDLPLTLGPLVDLASGGEWDEDLLTFVAGGAGAEKAELKRKLGGVEKDGGSIAGRIGRYFVERYGFREGEYQSSLLLLLQRL